MPNRDEDRRLIEQCISGSKTAWESIVTRYAEHVRFTIIRTLSTHGVSADDVTVEDLQSRLFLNLVINDFHKLRTWRGQASLKGWLRVMAANLTIDSLRRRRKTSSVDDEDGIQIEDPKPTPEEAAGRAQMRERMRRLWAQLSPADQAFVQDYFVHELSFAEIAAKTGATHGALYARKNRVRKQLADLAKADGWFRGDAAADNS